MCQDIYTLFKVKKEDPNDDIILFIKVTIKVYLGRLKTWRQIISYEELFVLWTVYLIALI